ncbi:Receptor-like protein 12 [Cucumis melo var. makuwa]|uniref:Receptor-like protein 12 n=1 Tax=Cucumis melo var. makuwa TaxID=1194695 RepID=A0A5D3E0S6_CUCMM|nr:Receptor-like protein 12 [Cucumis melo var. makuwa]
MKVTIIEEANDITTKKLDELFGSLRTFELSLNDNVLKKKSSIEIQGVSEDMAKSNPKQPQDENLAKTVALLSRRFSKFKSKFYKKSGEFGTQSNKKNFTNSSNSDSGSFSSFVASRRRDGDRSTVQIDRSIKCHEYGGFEHYQVDCATYLKPNKKRLVVTLSDEESSSDSDCENFGRALISSVTDLKEDLPVVSKKKELKTTLSELEEVLSMWEKDQEVLLSYLGNNCEDDEKGKPLLTIRPQYGFGESSRPVAGE